MTNPNDDDDDNDNFEEEEEEKPNVKSPKELEETAQLNKKDFSELLDVLKDINPKQKSLWKLIYENAIEDRKNAYMVWTDLYVKVHGDEGLHFKHGAILAKYMERFEKANEQILKLAALVDKMNNKSSDSDEPTMSSEDIFKFSEKKFAKSNK